MRGLITNDLVLVNSQIFDDSESLVTKKNLKFL